MAINFKQRLRARIPRVRVREVNTVLAHAASFMLTGVPPQVCESVINEFYCSVKRSLSQRVH